MTIPRLPGPLDWLTQTVGAGVNAYDQQKMKQYEEAQAGARTIMHLIQQGQLKPEQLSDPATIQAFQAAKIPVPNAANIIPSVKAAEAGRVVGRIQGTTPGSTEESLMLDLPTLGQIKEADFMAEVQKIRDEVFQKYPSVARKIAGVFAPAATTDQELAAGASAAPKEYEFAAENFVAQSQGDATKAKALAQADPQYAELVSSGQLSDEYFARAAREYSLIDEKNRQAWAEIAARRAAAEREQRFQYDAQRKSFDVEIAQLQKTVSENQLSMIDAALAGTAQTKLQRGEKLSALEQEAIAKMQRGQAAQQQIDEMAKQRGELRGQYISTTNPTANPTGNVNPAKVQAIKLAMQRGELTDEQVRNSPALTAEEKAQILGGTSGRSGSARPPKK
jgi:hypothetical protein